VPNLNRFSAPSSNPAPTACSIPSLRRPQRPQPLHSFSFSLLPRYTAAANGLCLPSPCTSLVGSWYMTSGLVRSHSLVTIRAGPVGFPGPGCLAPSCQLFRLICWIMRHGEGEGRAKGFFWVSCHGYLGSQNWQQMACPLSPKPTTNGPSDQEREQTALGRRSSPRGLT